MSTTIESKAGLEDFKVPVKLKLAALWAAVMFCYVYGDIFVLQQPGHLDELIKGTVWYGGPLTQNLLLAFAISMSIPAAMIFLTLALKPTISRWANIGFGLFCTIFMGLTLLAPGAWYFYKYLGAVETVFTLLIVWNAWTWPKK